MPGGLESGAPPNRKAKRRRPTFIRAFREKTRRPTPLLRTVRAAGLGAGSRGLRGSPARRDECRASGRGGGVAALSASRVFARAIRGRIEVSFGRVAHDASRSLARRRPASRGDTPRAVAPRCSPRGLSTRAARTMRPDAVRLRPAPARARRRASRRRPKARDEAQLGGRPGEARVAAEDAAVQSQRDTADVLRILKVVRAIRNRGHLSAPRPARARSGRSSRDTRPWRPPCRMARRHRSGLLSGYPDGLFLRGRK